MQTFLPYADFAASAAALDQRRLGKQRVETFQILRALTFPAYAWKNHPAVAMWRGFVPALVAYGLVMCDAWEQRGFTDTVAGSLLEFTGGVPPDVGELRVHGQLPPWLGTATLHVSHRSSLVRKEPEHYRRFFPDVPDDLPYLWPTPAFPRWPVRRPAGAALGLQEALAMLGLDAARPGQVEALAALAAGLDVLLEWPAGSGGSTTGLLAGLTAKRPTLWVTLATDVEPDDATVPLPAPPPPDRPAVSAHRAGAGGGKGKGKGSPTARPPTTADLAAMAEEAAAGPDFLFLSPAALDRPPTAAYLAEVRPGRVVVQNADGLSASDKTAVADAVRTLGTPPILTLSRGSRPAGTGCRSFH